ncbi:alpha/beta hydrolase [Erwinia sp. CPCC 100877]|nr:alpha/beta hydrolase [Erwinia sp. CPCC 100877]
MRQKLKRGLLIAFGIIVGLIAIGIFYIHTQTYQPTTQAAASAAKAEATGNTIIFKGKADQPAVIFYQGALVNNASYSLWAKKVAEKGYTVYLPKAPFNLAILGENSAEKIIEQNHIQKYVIGGHSLGGVIASRFAADHLSDEHLAGVFFFASYPEEKGDLSAFKGGVLSLTGSQDGVLNRKSYEKGKDYLPEQTVFAEIKGGNHAGFGSYGEQKGDNLAEIANEEQQAEIADQLVQWLQELN